MAELKVKRTFFLSETERLDLNLWEVPSDKEYPEGKKYSVNYSTFVQGKWIDKIRIDNKKREGHHLHFKGVIKEYSYVSFEKVVKDVNKLIKKLKGGE